MPGLRDGGKTRQPAATWRALRLETTSATTASNIAAVSRPVFVFCREQ
jgi:hypothetical protein